MKIKLLLFSYIISCLSFSQNTVGVISAETGVEDGYVLFTIHTETFLIDNCGRTVNQWTSEFLPGAAVYLLPNGNLLRAGRSTDGSTIGFGGMGGIVELFNWDGDLIWQFDYSTDLFRQHHDIFPMPNDNILILAATLIEGADAIQAGRDPNQLSDGELYNEQIIEVEPVGTNQANIVWEWNIIDHVIQDFDNTKDNFGDVHLTPQKLDINFLNGGDGGNNWLHINSMQYNAELDQIILSSRNLSEIWIIDHSTTTAEAATSSGGTYGKGGDLLYRWGNPLSYRQGLEADRQLFGQHYPHTIANGFNDEGKIILFNNGIDRTPLFSEVLIIDPPQDSPGFYTYDTGAYGPLVPDYIYDGPSVNGDFQSSIVSSAQRLPNGNTLICEGRTGEFFEIDSSDNIVWEYINPVNNATGGITIQGEEPSTQNLTFRAIRYTPDFAGFIGRDLTPGDPIEINPDLSSCDNLSVTEFEEEIVTIFPNPTKGEIILESKSEILRFEVYDLLGKRVMNGSPKNDIITIDALDNGIYILNLYSDFGTISKRIIKN